MDFRIQNTPNCEEKLQIENCKLKTENDATLVAILNKTIVQPCCGMAILSNGAPEVDFL
jgi:hypothetical protein